MKARQKLLSFRKNGGLVERSGAASTSRKKHGPHGGRGSRQLGGCSRKKGVRQVFEPYSLCSKGRIGANLFQRKSPGEKKRTLMSAETGSVLAKRARHVEGEGKDGTHGFSKEEDGGRPGEIFIPLIGRKKRESKMTEERKKKGGSPLLEKWWGPRGRGDVLNPCNS